MKPSILSSLVIVVLFTSALHGQAPFTLKRFGRALVSDAEVAQIAELASSAGKPLWLLRTPSAVMMAERVSYLFLAPDVLGKRVLRGRVLRLQPPIPVGAFLTTVPAAPISVIAHRDEAIVVGLRPHEEMGHGVWLVRKDG